MASDLGITELRGLGLPARRSSGGYFSSLSRYDVAFSDLVIAIFTPLGSRPLRRNFGSAVHLVLFDPATVASQQQLTYAIRSSAQRSAPHIYITEVKAHTDGHKVAVGIKFGLVNEQTVEERTVLITKSDIIKLLAAAKDNP